MNLTPIRWRNRRRKHLYRSLQKPKDTTPPELMKKNSILSKSKSIFQVSLGICLFVGFAATARGNALYLDADPTYSFGSTQPNIYVMATAIQARLGKAVTVVTTLPNENTTFPPVLGDSGNPPYYVYGPSINGAVKNLNLNTTIINGLTSAKIRFSGTDVIAGVSFNRFVLRVSTATQYNDILVKVIGFSGTPSSYSAVWDFDQISSPRPN
jgi:hypothetical protein